MALVVKDRVKETTATTGTGIVTLDGAAGGFQSFSVIGDGNTTYYAIFDSANEAWEVGVGTYTASGTTLSRDTVLESSNAGSLVNFGSGTKFVFCTLPAERTPYLNTDDTSEFFDSAGTAVALAIALG
jgi:Ca2+-binding RTX toxin-like protein